MGMWNSYFVYRARISAADFASSSGSWAQALYPPTRDAIPNTANIPARTIPRCPSLFINPLQWKVYQATRVGHDSVSSTLCQRTVLLILIIFSHAKSCLDRSYA